MFNKCQVDHELTMYNVDLTYQGSRWTRPISDRVTCLSTHRPGETLYVPFILDFPLCFPFILGNDGPVLFSY